MIDMEEEQVVGGKPIEEYRERVAEGDGWWQSYCANQNKKMYRHHLSPYPKVAIGCQLFPDRSISNTNNPRRYSSSVSVVGDEEE